MAVGHRSRSVALGLVVGAILAIGGLAGCGGEGGARETSETAGADGQLPRAYLRRVDAVCEALIDDVDRVISEWTAILNQRDLSPSQRAARVATPIKRWVALEKKLLDELRRDPPDSRRLRMYVSSFAQVISTMSDSAEFLRRQRNLEQGLADQAAVEPYVRRAVRLGKMLGFRCVPGSP